MKSNEKLEIRVNWEKASCPTYQVISCDDHGKVTAKAVPSWGRVRFEIYDKDAHHFYWLNTTASRNGTTYKITEVITGMLIANETKANINAWAETHITDILHAIERINAGKHQAAANKVAEAKQIITEMRNHSGAICTEFTKRATTDTKGVDFTEIQEYALKAKEHYLNALNSKAESELERCRQAYERALAAQKETAEQTAKELKEIKKQQPKKEQAPKAKEKKAPEIITPTLTKTDFIGVHHYESTKKSKKQSAPKTANKPAAVDDKKQKIKELTEQADRLASDANAGAATAAAFIAFLKTQRAYKAYSDLNCALVFLQNPTVKMINSFSAWKAEGRRVKKGEHGLLIRVPMPYKIEIENEAGEKEEQERCNFRVEYVFDVSQTEEIKTA